ncbi:MAG TPA: nucleotidyltransferase family protein [Isosphaeraceae bacterium]|jgi:molybdenum cofactor cytidylyltransferase|nr:nucleotidyltransferase family protein [Isosphaeraceae bacterium]
MIAALVPAAGQSRRMGQPKLLLTIGGQALIARVVSALRKGGAGQVVVVAPPSAEPGAQALRDEAGSAGAHVVTLSEPTSDMRSTIEAGLDWLEHSCDGVPDALLLAPGDSPGLTPALVSQVIDFARAQPGAIVVPTFGGRRGHPVLLPWSIAQAIRSLPLGTGVNALTADRGSGLVTLEVGDPGTLADLDTPEDYSRWGP